MAKRAPDLVALARLRAAYIPDDVAELAAKVEPERAAKIRASVAFADEVREIRALQLSSMAREFALQAMATAALAPASAFFTFDQGQATMRPIEEIPPELHHLLDVAVTPSGTIVKLKPTAPYLAALAKMLEPAPRAMGEPPAGGATEEWARSVLRQAQSYTPKKRR